jgi:hypothetical protein
LSSIKPDTRQQQKVNPTLTLRLGFAGNIQLPDERAHVRQALDQVVAAVAERLAAIAQATPGTQAAPHVAEFYAADVPVLRLVTGLAEGADTEAFEALGRLAYPGVRKELAAVLGCDVKVYHDSRSAQHRGAFVEQLAQCAYVYTLDGRYVSGEAGKPQRARLYRAQADMLLRHSDILVALADPEAETKPGGTLETVRKALAFELPVVFIHSTTGAVTLIEPSNDLTAALTTPIPGDGTQTHWRAELRHWITTIVADPDAGLPIPGSEGAKSTERQKQATEFLHEYFNANKAFPTNEKGDRKKTLHEWWWSVFATRFDKGPKVAADPGVPGYAEYRRRATNLNYHYVGLYRGAFVLNYALAVLAVGFAALSLVLLGKEHTELVETVADTLPLEAPSAPHATGIGTWLMVLAGAKLFILLFIYINTKRAHHGKWNERAVNYRYLAERLRTMFYLPRLGSFQPPSASPPQFASRVVRQSAVDWLFDAITRSVSPAVLAKPTAIELSTGSVTVPLITMDPSEQITLVKDKWIKNQVDYHDKNSHQMEAMDRFLEKFGALLNLLVILFVSSDIVLLFDHHFHFIPAPQGEFLHTFTPWLIFLAALLPAAVASLNGIRFQSECQRLAERSAVVRVVLAGRENELAGRLKAAAVQAKRGTTDDPGSWNNETLRLGEAVANDLVQEVAEWSVLYAKELAEP